MLWETVVFAFDGFVGDELLLLVDFFEGGFDLAGKALVVGGLGELVPEVLVSCC